MISYIHVAESMSDLMAKAGMNTLLGMGTVFCVLILIMFLISSFKLLSVFENRSEKKDEKTRLEQGERRCSASLLEKTYWSHWGPGGPQAPLLQDHTQLAFRL